MLMVTREKFRLLTLKTMATWFNLGMVVTHIVSRAYYVTIVIDGSFIYNEFRVPCV